MVNDKFLDTLRESLEKRIRGEIKVYTDKDIPLLFQEAGNGKIIDICRVIIEVNNLIRWRYSITDDFMEDHIDVFPFIDNIATKIVEAYKKSLLDMALKGE